MSKVGFGLTNWDEQMGGANTGAKRNDAPKFPFARLGNGNNFFRIVTDPYKYFSIKYKNPNEKGFGKRINTAWPLHDDCPAKAAGFKPKKRYLVGVIDRSDGEIKILDMSIMVYEQLRAIKDAIDGGDIKSFDINVRVNREASATNYYMVMAQPASPLSEAAGRSGRGIAVPDHPTRPRGCAEAYAEARLHGRCRGRGLLKRSLNSDRSKG